MIPAADQRLIQAMFAKDLAGRVRLDLFTQPSSPLLVPGQAECRLCPDAEALAKDLDALSDKLSLRIHDIKEEAELASDLAIDHVPAFVLRGKTNRPLRIFGMPTGSVFPILLDAIAKASTAGSGLAEENARLLKKVKTPIDVRLLTTPSCQNSPALVRTALQVALQNSKVAVTVIEASEFPDLAQRYFLRAVPLTVLNESVTVLGAMDETTFVNVLRQTVEGKELDEKMKTGPFTSLAKRRARPAKEFGLGPVLLPPQPTKSP